MRRSTRVAAHECIDAAGRGGVPRNSTLAGAALRDVDVLEILRQGPLKIAGKSFNCEFPRERGQVGTLLEVRMAMTGGAVGLGRGDLELELPTVRISKCTSLI